MTRSLAAFTVLLAPLVLAACGDSTPPTQNVAIQTPPTPPPLTEVVTPPPATEIVSPAPPPPAHSELVPPPPQGAGRVAWQPGHWRYTGAAGSPWEWSPGIYVPVPTGQSMWTPGRWMMQPSGGWVWVEGHWA